MSNTGLLYSSDTSANEESASEVPEEKKQESLSAIDENSLHDKGQSPMSFASQDEDERIRSGDFSNVVGPDSPLSQELQDMSQRTAVMETYDQQGPVLASSLLSQDLTQMSSQDSSPPTASNVPAGTMSSSQLSCLVRAAKELESPLPSPAKGATIIAAASLKAATSNKQLFDSSHVTYFDTTYKPPSKNSLYSPPRKVQSLEPRRAKQPALREKQSKPTRRASKTRAEKEWEQTQARQLAKQAAVLAAQAIASPEISKQLLLSMVFCRANPRSPPASWPPKGSVIEEGFFWGQYPPLETKLKSYMRAYYDLSVQKCQSKEQQAFNNDMVVMIRAEAAKYGWSFSPNFSEKSLRDRVRCYFKTHVQNSKKRLRTMLMNPTKKANTKALIGHLDMIRAYADRNTKDVGKEEEEVQLMAERAEQVEDYDAVQRMMSLGFAHLSQDSQAVSI